MKDKIFIFIIGLLAGAVLATGAFYIYTKANPNTCTATEQTNKGEPPGKPDGDNGGEPPEKPDGDNGGEPPEKPDGENSTNNKGKES